MSEYSNQTVGSACSFATLATYNNANTNNSSGMMNQVQAQRSQINTSGLYIVPDYAAPGYDTLTKGGSSCSGFLNITDAYGIDADKCSQKYLKKICQ
jgi:hypothetical protein